MEDKERAVESLELASLMSNLAHEFAVERGLTSNYINSQGRREIREILLMQHEKANQLSEKFIQSFQSLKNQSINPLVINQLDKLRMLLEKRVEYRKKFLSLDGGNKVDEKEVSFDYYSNINTLSLNYLENIHIYLEDSQIIRRFNAYLSLLWLKEWSGRERGVLNDIYLRQSFSEDKGLKINEFLQFQRLSKDAFYRSASTKEIEFFEKYYDSHANEAVNRMRDEFHKNKDLRNIFKNILDEMFDSLQEINGVIHVQEQIRSNLFSYLNERQMQILMIKIDQVMSRDELVLSEVQSTKKLSDLMASLSLLDSIEPREWYNQATKRIVAIKKTSDHMFDIMISDVKSQAQWQFILTLMLISLSLLIILVSWLLPKTLLNHLMNDLEDLPENLSKGSNNNKWKTENSGVENEELSKTTLLDDAQSLKVYLDDIVERIKIGDFSKKETSSINHFLVKDSLEYIVQSLEDSYLTVENILDYLLKGDVSEKISEFKKPSKNDHVNRAMHKFDASIRDLIDVICSVSEGGQSVVSTDQAKGILGKAFKALDHLNKRTAPILQGLQQLETNKTLDGFDLDNGYRLTKNTIEVSDQYQFPLLEIMSEYVNCVEQGRLHVFSVDDMEQEQKVFVNKLNQSLMTLNTFCDDIRTSLLNIDSGKFSTTSNTQLVGCKEGFYGGVYSQLESVNIRFRGFFHSLNNALTEANNGVLNHPTRINAEGNVDTLSHHLNAFLHETCLVIQDISRQLNHINTGNLEHRIQNRYSGAFSHVVDQIKYNV